METMYKLPFLFLLISSYPTYEEWKPFYQTSLQKLEYYCSYPTYEEWKRPNSCPRAIMSSVLILPMRNGNWGDKVFGLNGVYCSYPTYEEWKLVVLRKYICDTHCSYPTYEEWKQFLLLWYNISSFCVLILPMRNGN